MAKNETTGKDYAAIVKAGKDYANAYSTYEQTVACREGIHAALTDAEYRRGYVSIDEQPGADFKPVQTYRVSYSSMDRTKDADLTQVIDNRGASKTMLKFTTRTKGSGPEAAVPR